MKQRNIRTPLWAFLRDENMCKSLEAFLRDANTCWYQVRTANGIVQTRACGQSLWTGFGRVEMTVWTLVQTTFQNLDRLD